MGAQGQHALVCDREVGGAGADDEDARVVHLLARPPDDRPRADDSGRVRVEGRGDLLR
jgi:hypothetical protein